jgi:hypothetical protein
MDDCRLTLDAPLLITALQTIPTWLDLYSLDSPLVANRSDLEYSEAVSRLGSLGSHTTDSPSIGLEASLFCDWLDAAILCANSSGEARRDAITSLLELIKRFDAISSFGIHARGRIWTICVFRKLNYTTAAQSIINEMLLSSSERSRSELMFILNSLSLFLADEPIASGISAASRQVVRENIHEFVHPLQPLISDLMNQA